MLFATVNVPISDWWGGSHTAKRADTFYNVQNTQLVPRYIFKYENRLSDSELSKDVASSIDDYSYKEFIPEIMPFVSESDIKLLEEFQVEDNPILVKFKTKEF